MTLQLWWSYHVLSGVPLQPIAIQVDRSLLSLALAGKRIGELAREIVNTPAAQKDPKFDARTWVYKLGL
jgi:hypothetical protein